MMNLAQLQKVVEAARLELAADNAKPLNCEPQCWLCRKPLETGQDVRPYQGTVRWNQTKWTHSRCAWRDALRRARARKAERNAEPDENTNDCREIWFPSRVRSGL